MSELTAELDKRVLPFFMPYFPIPELAPVLSVRYEKRLTVGQAHSVFPCDPVGMVLVRRTAHSLSLRHGRSYMIIDTPALAGSFFYSDFRLQKGNDARNSW